MWVSHLLEQRRSGHCVVHLGGIWKWRDRHGHKQSRAFQPPPPSSHPSRLKPSGILWTYAEDRHAWKSIRQRDSRPGFYHCTATCVVKTVCGAVRKGSVVRSPLCLCRELGFDYQHPYLAVRKHLQLQLQGHPTSQANLGTCTYMHIHTET